MSQSQDPHDLEANTSSHGNFSFSIDQLSELHDPKSLRKLQQLGGINSLTNDLKTDPISGLPINIPDIQQREAKYGKNQLPQKVPKSFIRLCFEALKDKTLIILSIAAVVSLALGLYETFGQPTQYDDEGKPQPKVEWVEGVAIMVAVAIVVLVGAANDYNKERQFTKLNAKKEDRQIIVYRSGEKHFISINDLVVGDLIYVETGDIVPADSVMVSGSCQCDESSLTGETDTIKKFAAGLALQSIPKDLENSDLDIGQTKGLLDPMLISGSKLLSGQGKAIVTAVGPNSMHGKIMISLNHEPEVTPLQERLDKLADGISKYGILIAVLLFFVLFFKFCADLTSRYQHITPSEKGTHFLDILIVAITIVVVAIPEGLPLAVTLALAFATTRMTGDGNLVRVLKSCETMGGATAVCSDKTGTLTENKMRVVKGSLGDEEFDDTADSVEDKPSLVAISKLNPDLKTSIVTNILLNSTAFENRAEEIEDARTEILSKQKKSIWSKLFSKKDEISPLQADDEPFVGSKTECALLLLAKDKFNAVNEPLEKTRNLAKTSIVQVIPFESSRKWGGVIMKTEKGFRFYIKGASELVFSRCKFKRLANGESIPITTEVYDQITDQITTLAGDALRTLSLAHRDFNVNSWPPKELQSLEDPSLADVSKLFGEPVTIVDSSSAPTLPNIVISNESTPVNEGLILDCLVGIQDPLRAGVKDAILQCQKAGVRVRMVTGDNILTAKAISKNCGILSEEDLSNPNSSMEGPVFRKLTLEERFKIVPELCVLARSSPDDKRVLVDTLKKLGEVVAVTGDGTNDAPALKLADVGFSMGIAGTEVAREASDIILMTDDFTSIVNAIKWGRTVSTSVRKFVQFQLTVNVTAVVLTFVSAVADSDNGSVLTAVQLLWVNLIMDTLAALALATDKPDDDVLNRKPMGRTAPLISTSMWKMILGQSAMQLIVTFTLHFAGNKIFFGSGDVTNHQKQQINALTFNTFVWLQFFKLFVTRKLDEGDGLTRVRDRISRSNLYFFDHFFRNWYFIAIACIIGGFQILIMFVGGAAFSVARQTGAMWGTAVICGLLAFPVGILIRITPDIWVERFFPTRAFNIVMKVLSFKWVVAPFKKSKVSDEEKDADPELPSSPQSSDSDNYLTVNNKSKFVRTASSSNSEMTGTTACSSNLDEKVN